MIRKTDELIAELNKADIPSEALEELRPGERIRVVFAMYLRHIAAAMKADPMLGLSLYESMEMALDQQVEQIFRPLINEAYHDGHEHGYNDAVRDLV